MSLFANPIRFVKPSPLPSQESIEVEQAVSVLMPYSGSRIQTSYDPISFMKTGNPGVVPPWLGGTPVPPRVVKRRAPLSLSGKVPNALHLDWSPSNK